ncbi:response regulator [Novosphingobium sp. 18052]|uniref:response regulator n=1 Tax=Novosphingobium sp. 18052 TaxID=2681400 RepID=UPI001F29BE77|nr:response regulator [Novosphingobium sp. 18052]
MAELPKAMEAGAFQSIEPVLIVDDDADWGKECAFSLRQMGYEPFVATSADEALALFVDHDISIAIVDYNLPGLDGITLIQEMAQQAEVEGRQLRFIMATGYATKDVAIDAMRASAIDFLEKPISQSDLRRALQRIRGLTPAPGARKVLMDKISNLSTELQRLAHLMDEPGRPAAAAPAPAAALPAAASPPLPGDPVSPERLTVFIRDQLRREAKRREIGGGELFGDPAWAMLLDLLLAKIEKRQVSVSSACIASGAPMSTALRLVRRLVDEDVLCRLPDEHDRRRHFLAINAKFEQPLVDYLTEQVRHRG